MEDRVVIVTGAGQGLGAAYAHAFAQAGASIVIAEIDGPNGAAVEGEIVDTGGRALAIETDVSDEASVAAMVETTIETFGRIDVLVNNAAIYTTLVREPFDQISVENWRRVIDVNVTGYFLCARAVVPHMRKAGWGRIINISSCTVPMGWPDFLHYVTSKSAVIGMARSMAREVGADGITVNAVLPGLTDTGVATARLPDEVWDAVINRLCIPRRETPDDLTGVLLFLASEDSGFITGQSIAVDGGGVHL